MEPSPTIPAHTRVAAATQATSYPAYYLGRPTGVYRRRFRRRGSTDHATA